MNFHRQPPEPVAPGICRRCHEAEVDLADGPLCRDCTTPKRALHRPARRPVVYRVPAGEPLPPPPPPGLVHGDVAYVGDDRYVYDEWEGWQPAAEVTWPEWHEATCDAIREATDELWPAAALAAAWSIGPHIITATLRQSDEPYDTQEMADRLWVEALRRRLLPIALPRRSPTDDGDTLLTLACRPAGPDGG